MTTQLPDYPILVARVLVTGVILALYAYDLARVFGLWRTGADRRRGSSFRALVKSVNLVLGLLVIFLGAVTAAFLTENPVMRDTLRLMGYVLLGTLLVGGIALAGSWQRDEPA